MSSDSLIGWSCVFAEVDGQNLEPSHESYSEGVSKLPPTSERVNEYNYLDATSSAAISLSHQFFAGVNANRNFGLKFTSVRKLS